MVYVNVSRRPLHFLLPTSEGAELINQQKVFIDAKQLRPCAIGVIFMFFGGGKYWTCLRSVQSGEDAQIYGTQMLVSQNLC